MKNSIRKSLSRVLCIAVLILVLGSQTVYAADTAGISGYLDSVMEFIQEEYYGELTDEGLIEDAIRGMFNSLDDYTVFYNNEEKDIYMESITGVFGGIGVTMEINGDYITIIKVFSESPAEKAGLQQGDKIVEAGGTDLVKATTEKAASIIRGEPGTKIKLGVLRNGEKLYFEMVREIIKVNPVIYENRNGIGYIKLDMFNENTSEYIQKALAEFDKRNITNIVLDLRDNPGGEVNQAVALADNFVTGGLITKLDYKSEKYTDLSYFSITKPQKYKVAVLVNGATASASEIVSGAIQDAGTGVLVGTKTFGKAKFQGLIPILTKDSYEKYSRALGIDVITVYELYDNDILPFDEDIFGYAKMTLGVYYTPKGRMIDGVGLTPDIQAADPEPVAEVSVPSIQRLTKSVDFKLNSQGSDVYNAKKILKVMGYDISKIDNNFDKEFEEAIIKYQKTRTLDVNGILDVKTQIALNADLLQLILKYDTQYAAAVKYLKGN